MVTMKRSASGKKRKESEMSVTMVMTSLRGGKKHKRTRRAVADAASNEEIKEVLGGFLVAGPSCGQTQSCRSLTSDLVR